MGSRTATPPGMPAVSATDLLWLDTLQRIVGRTAHEVKGVLNAVAVNLEVVRSRAARPDTPVSAIAKYAASAADQFDAAISMTDALLALARPAPTSMDVGGTVRKLAALLAPAARVDGRCLTLEGSLDELGATGTTGAGAAAARLAIGAALLGAIDSSSDVVCRAGTLDGAPALCLAARDGALLAPLAADVHSAVVDAGIEILAEPSALSIRFPLVGVTETA